MQKPRLGEVSTGAALAGFALLASAAFAQGPDLRIESAGLRDEHVLALRLYNASTAPAGPFVVSVTTRAGERMIGTAAHTIAALGAQESREERVPFSTWLDGHPRLAGAIGNDCCRTRVVLDPGDEIAETDEANNVLEFEHPLPALRER